MKLSTTLFISLIFSAIVIKAKKTNEESDDYNHDTLYYDENEIEMDNFQFKSSKKLEEMEKNLSGDQKKFVEDGNVKETMTNTFLNSMKTETAVDGLAKLKLEWNLMFNGPEASMVIGTLGGNSKKVFTSPEGANMINMIASTIHVLLAKAGKGNTEESGLGKLLSSIFFLCTSPQMSTIVNKSGELVISAVNKPMAAKFIRQFWNELQQLLGQKDLNKKINNNFASMKALMKSLYNRKIQITQ